MRLLKRRRCRKHLQRLTPSLSCNASFPAHMRTNLLTLAQATSAVRARCLEQSRSLAVRAENDSPIMIVYSVYTMLDWPGLRTSIVTCFFVALGSIGETVHKLVLRLSGAIIGGLIADYRSYSSFLTSLTSDSCARSLRWSRFSQVGSPPAVSACPMLACRSPSRSSWGCCKRTRLPLI